MRSLDSKTLTDGESFEKAYRKELVVSKAVAVFNVDVRGKGTACKTLFPKKR